MRLSTGSSSCADLRHAPDSLLDYFKTLNVDGGGERTGAGTDGTGWLAKGMAMVKGSSLFLLSPPAMESVGFNGLNGVEPDKTNLRGFFKNGLSWACLWFGSGGEKGQGK